MGPYLIGVEYQQTMSSYKEGHGLMTIYEGHDLMKYFKESIWGHGDGIHGLTAVYVCNVREFH